ncbi:uncharacterized protein LOC117120459 [Anneissia japonica]|uniref:uncharacterized protein LOC117120459 n=1 Tax=Anneissia japonica TaxID=1529436 RepID=UPI00142575F2|nr:uncharacterized protein LOC117120459 [Anneissia japonica]
MARFMLNVILILKLHVYLVSSRGIMDRTMPTNVSCQLDIEGAKAMEVIQREGSVYINMNLKFVNSSGVEIDQILDDTDTIVNIKRWVLAIGPRGVQLLKYPNNAVPLSLGTLKPGVVSVSLNVSSLVDCFLNANDSEKLDIIASSLANFQSPEGLKLDQAICLEQLLTQNFIPSASEYFFYCWRLVIENEYYTNKTRIVVVTVLSMCVLHYLSFFILLFLCRNLPLNYEGTEYISISTDLNIGFKYVLFFAGNERYCCLFYVRCLVFVGLWQYLPLITNYVLVEEEYRSSNYLIITHIINSLTIGFTILVLCLYRHFITQTDCDIYEYFSNQLVRRRYLPANVIDDSMHGFQNVENTIKQTLLTLVTYRYWKGVWEQSSCASFGLKVIYIILFTTPLNLICLFCMCWMLRSRKLRLAAMIYFPLYYGWLITFSLYQLVMNLLEILYYFFVGLLTNSSYIFNVVLVSFLVIGYFLTTVTNFHAGYVKFLRQVITLLDEVVESSSNPDQANVGINGGQPSNLYIKDNDWCDGLTYIKKDFFDEIIIKYRPLGPNVMIMLVKLAIIGLITYIAVDTLQSIDQVHLSMEARSISVIFIPFVISIFYALIKNAAQEKNETKLLKARVKHYIKQRLR